jgi:hypothetical protein
MAVNLSLVSTFTAYLIQYDVDWSFLTWIYTWVHTRLDHSQSSCWHASFMSISSYPKQRGERQKRFLSNWNECLATETLEDGLFDRC